MFSLDVNRHRSASHTLLAVAGSPMRLLSSDPLFYSGVFAKLMGLAAARSSDSLSGGRASRLPDNARGVSRDLSRSWVCRRCYAVANARFGRLKCDRRNCKYGSDHHNHD